MSENNNRFSGQYFKPEGETLSYMGEDITPEESEGKSGRKEKFEDFVDEIEVRDFIPVLGIFDDKMGMSDHPVPEAPYYLITVIPSLDDTPHLPAYVGVFEGGTVDDIIEQFKDMGAIYASQEGPHTPHEFQGRLLDFEFAYLYDRIFHYVADNPSEACVHIQVLPLPEGLCPWCIRNKLIDRVRDDEEMAFLWNLEFNHLYLDTLQLIRDGIQLG